jgi:putative transposase
MARLGRVIVPRYPKHVTQRGDHRLRTLFEDADYAAYVELMADRCGAARCR